MFRTIFDLDGTVIDSSHRKATLPDGSLDLDHWIENCTPEKIAGDSLLPLAGYMRQVYPHHEVLICTARVMSGVLSMARVNHVAKRSTSARLDLGSRGSRSHCPSSFIR